MTRGILLVSHVQEIGEGLEKLLREVAGDVPITVAAGTNEGEVGTSFDKVQAAIDENDAQEILAFYDLGSAKMNLEMAGEMTDKQLAIYDVAFIEGAYTAASLLQVDVDPAEIDQQLKKLSL